jgi:hypothetical protein
MTTYEDYDYFDYAYYVLFTRSFTGKEPWVQQEIVYEAGSSLLAAALL